MLQNVVSKANRENTPARIMSGVVVLVSIMLVLTYGKSRKKAGSSPICGVIGTVPFQVLMVLSTLLSAIGALIPLS